MGQTGEHKRRIIVTGGLGYVGSRLVARLLKDEDNYVAIVDSVRSRSAYERLCARMFDHPRAVVYTQDVVDELRMQGTYLSVRPTHVFHLATDFGDLPSSSNEEMFRTNVLGTHVMLDLHAKFAKQAVFVFSSTIRVYGTLDEYGTLGDERLNVLDCMDHFEVHENSRTDSPLFRGIGWSNARVAPRSPFGTYKACADLMVQDACRTNGLRTIVLRQSTIYDSDQPEVMPEHEMLNSERCLIGSLAKMVSAREKFLTGVVSKETRDFLHVDDLIELYVRLLEPKVVSHVLSETSVLDVGGGVANTASMTQIFKMLAEAVGMTYDDVVQRTSLPAPASHLSCRWFAVDLGPTERLTGWIPTTSVRTGVKACFRSTGE